MKTRINPRNRLRALELLGVIILMVALLIVVGLITRLLIGVAKKKLNPTPPPSPTNSVAVAGADYAIYTADSLVTESSTNGVSFVIPEQNVPIQVAGPWIEIMSQRLVEGGTELTFSISLPADLVFSDQFAGQVANVTVQAGNTLGGTTNWQSVASTQFNLADMEFDVWYWFETTLSTTNASSSGFYRACAQPAPP